MPFTIKKNLKIKIGINLMKEVTEQYNKNHKTVRKEVNEVIRSWKHILCSWISRIHIVKITKSNLYVQCSPY
jgi:hypothetical protein